MNRETPKLEQRRLLESRILDLALYMVDLYARLVVSTVQNHAELTEEYKSTNGTWGVLFWDLDPGDLRLIERRFETAVLREAAQKPDLATWVPESWHQAPKTVEEAPQKLRMSKLAQAVRKRNQVFISYSHADAEWLKRLRIHLAPLEREGVVSVWDDKMIASGERWRKEIEIALQSTKIAVLLVSADFLASKFIAEDELPPLLKMAEADGALILPVIVSPSLFKGTIISEFQAINSPDKPLTSMDRYNQETVFVQVAERVKNALTESPRRNDIQA